MIPPVTISDQASADPLQAQWFNAEVQPHDASLKNYLRRSFPSVRDIDDVVQESYLRVWKRQMVRPITEVAGSVQASVKGFLFQVARRLALDTIRHERASPLSGTADVHIEALAVTTDGADVRETAYAQQEFEFLLEAIDALPTRCREVLVHRKLHGFSTAETAAKLGISEATVHVQMRRGLQRVETSLRHRGLIRGPGGSR